MKKIFLLLWLIISTSSYSQIVKLAKLSSGELLANTILYDHEKNDIYGYFYIFSKDNVNKNEFTNEYVLLDKNLNKVISGEYNLKIPPKVNYTNRYMRYFDGFISIKHESGSYGNISGISFWSTIATKYRLINVRDNTISDPFVLSEDLQKIPDNTTSDKDFKKNLLFEYIPNPLGYYLFSPLRNAPMLGDGHTSLHDLAYKPHIMTRVNFVDRELNVLWGYEYNIPNPTYKNYVGPYFPVVSYKNKKEILVFGKQFLGKENLKKEKAGEFKNSFLFFNKNDGKLLSEIYPFGKESENNLKDIREQKIFIDDNKAIFINFLSTDKQRLLNKDICSGYSKVEYSINDGQELKRNNFSWKQLSNYLDIDENGYIREKDDPNSYLYLHDIILKDNGNSLYILEEYKSTGRTAKINDMFFMELDKDMKLIQFKRIKKELKYFKNGFRANGSTADRLGNFDYIGYQDLGNDNYLFFYYNKQKPEKEELKEWEIDTHLFEKQRVLGILSYIDGKLSEQKIPLKSEDGSEMFISPAKKGYIMIYESFKDKDKSAELRLEKINY